MELGSWKKDVGREKYWDDKKIEYREKEQWARLRCENVGKAVNMGFQDVSCRLCGEDEENIEHIVACRVAKE